MGIVERIEYDPNRSSRIAPVRWIEGVQLRRQRKCNTIEEFAPPRKILEPTTTTIRGLFSFSSLPGKVDQRKVACFSPGPMAAYVVVFVCGLAIFYGLWLGWDPLLGKLQSILLKTVVRRLFFGWGWKGAALFQLSTHCIEGVFSGNLSLYVGCDGASSSKRPSFDLNMPPEEEETEKATTEEPPEDELREMEEHIFRRLRATAPPGTRTTPEQLLAQARETASLKRKLIDQMPALDPDNSDFWRTHRYGLVTDAILTKNQNEGSIDSPPLILR